MSKESATAMLSAMPAPVAATPEITSTPGGEPGLQATESQTSKVTELDSTRFAQLAKKESALQKEREQFKLEKEANAQEKEKMKQIHKKLQDFEDMKGKDPVAALKLAGFSETDLFNFMAQAEDKSTPEEKAAKAAQTEIQKFRDEESKKVTLEQERRNTEALEQFQRDINTHITSDKDRYEYCNYHGQLAEELIKETVAAVLDESGGKDLITVEQAADMVEGYYEEQDKSMSTLKKRQPKVADIPASVKEEPLKAQVSARPASKGLSSKATATVSSTTIPRKESASEKRNRLIQKLGSMGK